jgi:hypothetical protein
VTPRCDVAEPILDELLVYLGEAAVALERAPQELEGVESPLAKVSHDLEKAQLRAQWLCDGRVEGAAADVLAAVDEAVARLQTALQSRLRDRFHAALHQCRALVCQARTTAADWYAGLPEPLERDELW